MEQTKQAARPDHREARSVCSYRCVVSAWAENGYGHRRLDTDEARMIACAAAHVVWHITNQRWQPRVRQGLMPERNHCFLDQAFTQTSICGVGSRTRRDARALREGLKNREKSLVSWCQSVVTIGSIVDKPGKNRSYCQCIVEIFPWALARDKLTTGNSPAATTST
jgi:hypothetical protein